ncbi:MAG TPA: HK97 family phage prohead protease [Ensifer sp.]|nr:HK97 family phage prohead protease [Ensifer sp.]
MSGTVVRKLMPSTGLLPSAPAGTDAYAGDNARRVRIRCSTATPDRANEVVVQQGISLKNFTKNPVILWNHDHSSPIARAVEVGLEGGNLMATVQFPPAGTNPQSDQIYNLIRADIVKAISVGFLPVETVPLDKGNPIRGPQKYLKSDLMEVSFCSVPCNPECGVTWVYATNGDEAARKTAALAEAKRKATVDMLKLKQPAGQAKRLRDVEVLRLKAARQ